MEYSENVLNTERLKFLNYRVNLVLINLQTLKNLISNMWLFLCLCVCVCVCLSVMIEPTA